MADEAIPAATLIAVRDKVGGAPEILMVERAGGMAFAAGAKVFPGGRIDAADRRLGERLGIDGAVVAAIRETIEETAIPVALAPLPAAGTAARLQDALVADADFGDLLDRLELSLDPKALVPFARWVPKFHAVRRFDTMFFVARAPDVDWAPKVVEGECARADWLTAQDVLDMEAAGAARLIFPTRRTLERLAQHDNFEAIRADALAHRIDPITPWAEERDGQRIIVIPDDLGFPVTQEKLDGLWRG